MRLPVRGRLAGRSSASSGSGAATLPLRPAAIIAAAWPACTCPELLSVDSVGSWCPCGHTFGGVQGQGRLGTVRTGGVNGARAS